PNQIPQLIASGEICDAKSIAALLTFLFVTKGK
ncbi:MAG: ADP-ribose pyrophosphatase, partial [Chloroflexi bacterium CG07_land_8_20_14_0_80_45_17]